MQKDISNLARWIDRKVEEKREEIVRLCCDLIRIPSVTGKEGKIQEFVAGYLEKMGLEVKTWDPDILTLKKHSGYIDTGQAYKGRPNVVGVYRGNGGKSLLLNGHTDVVTPEPVEKWSHNPWGAEIAGGNIYGRGACDMKGGVAGMIMALQILMEMNLRPPGDVILEIVVDEEAGGNGTLASLIEGYRADAAIFTEPTGCNIMPAHRGASFWRVYVDGKGAHGGIMHKGVSAIEKAMLVSEAIKELRESRNQKNNNHPLYKSYPVPVPLCIGKIKGGEWPSAVPEKCVLEGTIEFLPGEKLEEVRGEFEKAVSEVSRKDPWLKEHPPEIEWFGLNFEAAQIPLEHSLVRTLKQAYKGIMGKEPHILGFPAGCDMRLRVLHGKTPSLLFGPGDISFAHRIDEFIEIDELILFTKILTLNILAWGAL